MHRMGTNMFACIFLMVGKYAGNYCFVISEDHVKCTEIRKETAWTK